MGTDKPQAAQGAWPSGSARPRLVLGMVLLILGVGDLLFMNVVLLPRVLAVEAVTSPRPAVGGSPASESSTLAGPEAGPAPQALAVAPTPSAASSPVEIPAPPTAPAAAPVAPVQPVQPSAPAPPPAVAAAPAPAPQARPPVTGEPSALAPADSEPAPSRARAAPSFAPLFFDSNSTWLSPAAGQTLTKLAALMKSDSTLRVELGGHTDDFGPERFNRMLSLKRAERVRARMEDLGVERARVDVKGYGSDQPVDSEPTAKARARNRRVEITFN